MPKTDFNLKTEYDFFSKAIIIDEIGELPALLVDALLNHGCLVKYFGKEKKQNFSYLDGKKNFQYLASKQEIDLTERLDYLFYFPSNSQPSFEEAESLIKLPFIKSLICASENLTQLDKIRPLIKDINLNVKIAYFNLVFGPRLKENPCGKWFASAFKEKKIILNGQPDEKINILPVKDLIRELIRLIFSFETQFKEYYLLPKEEINYFILSNLIKNLLSDVNIEFLADKKESFREPVNAEKIKINFNLEEKLQEEVDWFERNSNITEKTVKAEIEKVAVQENVYIPEEISKQPVLENEPKNEEREESFAVSQKTEDNKLSFLFTEKQKILSKSQKPSFFKKMVFGTFLFFLLIFVFFVFPLGLSFGSGSLGIKKVTKIKEDVADGDFSSAIIKADQANKLFSISKKTMTITGPFYGLIGFGKQIEQIYEVFPFAENLFNSLKSSLKAAQRAVELEKKFFNEEENQWQENLSLLKTDLASAYEQASLSQASLEKIEPLFKFFGRSLNQEKVKTLLTEGREVVLKGQNLTAVLSRILGVGSIKTYLVLIQNNTELRPTGGFIGSYGIVRLENGKLINFEVFNSYQADSQLKGQVDPPETLTKYLSETTWYLRDSNWDPDFVLSAQRAQWFLDKEMQITADGTIALNLEVIKKLLKAVGEVEVVDYNDKINADNLYQKTEQYSDIGSFPGSSQRLDFLGSLVKEIFEKTKTADSKQLVDITGAIFSSLDQKEMMLYFNDPGVESVISKLEWEGSIRSYQQFASQDAIFTDYLSIIESNVGVNKANFYVQRKIDHQISINDTGKVQEKLTITYDNLSPSENWPSGRYKNYLRVYLEKDSKLTSVFINDPKNSGLWLPLESENMDFAEEHNKAVYGFLLEVPIKSQRKIEINYELANSLVLSSKLTSYLLMVQKQSGALSSIYDLRVSYPASFIPLRVIPSAIVGNQQLLISSKLGTDIVYQIDWAR